MINKTIKLFLVPGIIALFSVTSCVGEKEKEVARTEVKAEIKINPAHGLAGHRCDIPVGIPLQPKQPKKNDKIGPNTVSPIQINQVPTVNPPHGEPGHDCGIPVGSPLG
ncbi:MAG TPA: hypothetical protein VFM70_09960 [Salinimicrobium sp.]|nr:hypothetical protein [Salinimicrobium sp.]